MNHANFSAFPTPSVIGRNAQGRATVTLADGRSVELEAFRDACRADAQVLRQQAICQAFDILSAAVLRLGVALSIRVRRALSSTPRTGIHTA